MTPGLAAFRRTIQRRFVYFPDTRRPDPAQLGVPGVQIGKALTQDGLSLLTWFAPPEPSHHLTVLYLHGNGGNIGYRADRLRRMSATGWGVLLLEYRGYGGNAGIPSEEGLWLDAQAGMAALRDTGSPHQQVLLWGESLGTGLAVRLATELPIAALLLEAPYTNLADVGHFHAPWLPVRLLLGDAYDSRARIARVRAPVLIMAGQKDTVIPIGLSRELFAAAPSPKELWIAPKGTHDSLFADGALDAAVAFVARHVRATA